MSGHQRLLKMASDQRKGELSQAAKLPPESLPSWLCEFDPRRPLRLVPWSGPILATSAVSDPGSDGTFMAHLLTSVTHSVPSVVVGDTAIPFGSGVLVPQGGPRRGVAEPAHQLPRRGARGSGKRISSVSQVMEPESRHADSVPGVAPFHVPIGAPEPSSLLAAEHEGISTWPDEAIEVLVEHRKEVGRDGNLTVARFGLRRSGDDPAADKLVLALGDVNDARDEVEALSSECQQLPEAEAAVGRQEHERAMTLADRICESIDLCDCGSGAFRTVLDPTSPDVAGVLREHSVRDGRPEHGTQQAVRLCNCD